MWGIMIWDGMNAINTRKNYILVIGVLESGAIAKILKLDDSSLKNTLYYPYDMVHYQEK